MRELKVAALLALTALPAFAAAEPDFGASWPQTVIRLETAVTRGDSAELKVLKASFDEALRADQVPAALNPVVRYASAYADWRLSALPDVTGEEKDDCLSEATRKLKEITESSDRFAEAHALLGSVYGMRIGRSPWTGMVLGPRSSAAIERAVALEPDNPRILLQQALGAFHTPRMFGGSKEKAEALLRRSIAAFERETEDTAWPNWGRADAHIWLGQVLQDKGDLDGAREAYQRALAVAPEHAWVRHVLLPGLDTKR